MRIPYLHSRPEAASSQAAPSKHYRQQSTLSLKTALFLSTAALCSFLPSVIAQATTSEQITYSFLNEDGEPIGQANPLPKVKCTPLASLNGQTYTSIQTSDGRSALNLYSDATCQVGVASSVGEWPNVSPTADVVAVRWEGAAPADRPTGNVSLVTFDKGLETQPYNPVDDDGSSSSKNPVWVMNPSKGRVVVGLVAAILVLGVAIGIYQVYVAAQYKPPPKKPKKPKTGLNIKKIKKKDAFYKKPARTTENGATFQRLEGDGPESYAGAGGRPALAMTERSRDSQHSEAATFVDWNNQSQQRSSPLSSGKGFQDGLNSVSIDMHGNNNNNNNNNNNISPFANSFSPDLMHFDNSGGRGYGQQQQGHNQQYRGRGGEVLVPMDTLDSYHQHGNNQYNTNNRSAVRRTSSSRSR